MTISIDSAPAALDLGTASRPARAGGTRVALRFLALSALAGAAGGILHLGVPLLALSAGATGAQVGLIRSVAGLGMLAVVLPVGFLVDRFGPGRLFRIGALVGLAIAVAFAAASSPVALVLLMALEGLTAPLRFTALGASFYGRLTTIGLDKAGWFKASMSVGLTLLGPLAGGVLARGAGFPALFGAVAGVHLVAALLGAPGELDGGAAHATPPRLRDQVADLGTLLRSPTVRPVLGVELLGAATFAAFSTFVVVVAIRGYGVDGAVASRILIVEGLAFVLTAFLSPRVAFLRGRLARVAGLAGAAGVAGAAAAAGPVALAVAGIAIGVATGLVHVHVASWIAGRPGAKGRISALFQTAAGLGVTLGPLAFSLGAWLPERATLLVFAPLYLALAVVGAGASTDRPRSSDMALDRQQIPRYLDQTPFIILSTVDAANGPATRTLASFAADDLTVYFSTGRGSDKIGQIGNNPNVSILFQHERQELPSFANVEIRGVAEVLGEGEEKAKAIALIARRNPRFKERAEQGQLSGSALVRVRPTKVKVVDFSRGHGPAAVASIEI